MWVFDRGIGSYGEFRLSEGKRIAVVCGGYAAGDVKEF